MRCPYCKNDNDRVVDSRSKDEGRSIRRRRECLSCFRRFSTLEEIEDKTLYVIKSDGCREAFDVKKLTRGIQVACSKRPISINQIESMVTKIQIEIESSAVHEVESRKIGEMVSTMLKSIDEVAYVRFASVYRKFKDKEEFIKELHDLENHC